MKFLTGMSRLFLFIRLFVFSLLSTLAARAQDGFLPYSNFGLGEANPIGGVRNMGMGGIGVSAVHPFYSNLQNPATLTYNKLTLFDFSARSEWINLRNDQEQISGYTANINHFNLIFPISSRITATAGLRSATSVDYRSTSLERIPSSPAFVRYVFDGTGGIRQAYVGTGLSLSKNFSLGFDIIYNFGLITRNEQSELIDGARDTQVGRETRTGFRKLAFDFGFLYSGSFGDKNTVHLGITYQPSFQHNFTRLQRLNRRRIDDVLLFSDTIIDDNQGSVQLPAKWAFGLSTTKDLKYTVGVDVILENWSVFEGLSNAQNGVNTYRINFGAEWTPDVYAVGLFKKMTYRTGFSYGILPWNIDGQQVKEFSVSIGFSIPLQNFSLLSYAISYHERLSSSTFIDIRYVRLSFGVVVNNRWFIKRKFN